MRPSTPKTSRVSSQRSLSRHAGPSLATFRSGFRRSEEPPHLRQQIVRQTGFDEKSIASGGHRYLSVGREGPSRERDDWHADGLFIALQLAHELEATHSRQDEVDDSGVW
jgi:hypothetical protein